MKEFKERKKQTEQENHTCVCKHCGEKMNNSKPPSRGGVYVRRG